MTEFPADVVSVNTGVFRVEMQSFSGQRDMWRPVFKPSADGDDWTSARAEFGNVVDAETFTNKMRKEHPKATYRVVRDITITQVVPI